jgi:hypothetical protein
MEGFGIIDLERYHQLRNTMTPEEAVEAMLEEKLYREASEEELRLRGLIE